MALAPLRFGSIQDLPDSRIVRSAVPIELSAIIALDKATTVYADEVAVTGTVSAPGQNVVINCRKLTFNSGASLVTAGALGTPNFDPGSASAAQPNPGADGPDGADGGRGQDGGSVEIYAQQILGDISIIASGGKGGRAQDGGDGRAGADGRDGRDATISDDVEYTPPPPECVPTDGGDGGSAGLPGIRGRGGNGGSIVIRTVVAINRAHSILTSTGGDSSPPANTGRPAAGGRAGTGGTYTGDWFEDRGQGFASVLLPSRRKQAALSRERQSKYPFDLTLAPKSGILPQAIADHITISSFHLRKFATDGSDNIHLFRAGDSRKVPDSRPGLPGKDRIQEAQQRNVDVASLSGAVAIDEFDLSALYKKLDPVFIQNLVCQVEDEYRSSAGPISESTKQRIDFLVLAGMATDKQTNQGSDAFRRAVIMSQRAALGLDFYGFSQTCAPLLSFETYQRVIDSNFISQASLIEVSFNDYMSYFDSKDKQTDVLRATLRAASSTFASYQSEINRVVKETKQYRSDIPLLESKVVAAYQLLIARQNELTKAIQSRHSGCDLMSALVACTAIIAGVASGGAGFVVAAGALKRLHDDMPAGGEADVSALWDEKSVLSTDLKSIATGSKSVMDSVKTIREAVGKLTPEEKQVPKFVMERAKFDEVAKSFTELPEASRYREAGYDYLGSVEARNQAILNYNASLSQVMEMKAKSIALQQNMDSIQSSINGKFDPADAIVSASMSQIYLDTLSLLAFMVHIEKKALSYHFADPAYAPVSALNIATITAAHQRNAAEWLSAKERYAAKRDLEPGLLTVSLKDLVSPDAWTGFKKDGSLAFTLRRDHPRYVAVFEALPLLRITGMALQITGAKVARGQLQIPWTLTHCGLESLYKSDETKISFSHRTIRFVGFTSLAGGKPLVVPDFSEKNLYAGVSPFSSWVLSVSQNRALGLDLLRVVDAKIQLFGYIVDG